jgi:AraC family transcriptional regulator of adaptative response / DNA-3-methyladenine glycosylase II
VLARQQYQQARMARDARFDGQFFVAVKTTGIFCRPICPAKLPREENVEYFTFAQQAMQAGYRPCLRCRPDSAPKSCAWQGVDTTVERALSLLRDNPEMLVQDIALKLGISDRYFRLLFQAALGVSPKQYQLFEQLLFAKQLLHQSALSVEQVAQASGFSSARRLQDKIKQVTGLSPRQIRRDKLIKTQTIKLELAFRPPYNWQHISDFFALRAIPEMEYLTGDSYARTFHIGQEKGWFCARFVEDKRHFAVQLELENIRHLKGVVQNIRRILDVDADIPVIQSRLISSGISPKQLRQGLRLPGIWNTFEAGCRAILGQQISVSAAIKLVTQLVKALGERHQHGLYFPAPETVAASDLLFLKMPASRRNTLRSLAAFYTQAENHNPDTWLHLKGIGPWTVAYAKMRGQSQPDIWLDRDLVVKKQLQKMAIDAHIAQPWRSYLSLQLWSMA